MRLSQTAGNSCQIQAAYSQGYDRGPVLEGPDHAFALSVHPSSANLLVDLPLTTSVVV